MIVIQLSDPHILASGELLYGRFDTAEFLARSVAEINRLDPLPDVAVITGDLVDHGEPAEYEHLRALLSPLAMPVFVIPGNHDAREPRSPQTVICRLTGFSSLRSRTTRSGSSPSTR